MRNSRLLANTCYSSISSDVIWGYRLINSVYMCTIIFLSWLFMEIYSGVQLLTWCVSIHRRYRVSVWPWQKNQPNYRSTLLKCVPNIALSFILCQEICKQYTVTNDVLKQVQDLKVFFTEILIIPSKLFKNSKLFKRSNKVRTDFLQSGIFHWNEIYRGKILNFWILQKQKFKYFETDALNFPSIKKIQYRSRALLLQKDVF